MTITLNIPYNDTYSSKISFETKMNEKATGNEQRYPVKTFPVRYFTLNFNKGQEQREALEAFFIECMGRGNEFQWTWATSKGGNGLTYTCRLDIDEFKRTIIEMGYGESMQLSFYAIDRNSYTPPANFDFYHKAKYDTTTNFNTLIDKAITANQNTRTLWTTPLKRWEIEFEKNKENRALIEAFFIAKRGKFKSFKWTWAIDKGGDGQEYDVRFDTDELDLDIMEMGYSTFKIPIKEVIKTDPTDPYAKDEIIPRLLFELVLSTGSIYILQNDTMESLTYGGQNYLGAPLEVEDIKQEDTTEVLKVGVTLSNVNQAISGIISTHGDVVTGATVNLYGVYLNTSTNEIIAGQDTILLAGKANNLELTIETAKINIEIDLGGYEQSCPRMTYGTNCQWQRFKDVRCGYTGDAATCDFTLTTCKRLGNVENFGGKPSVPAESMIKA